MSQQQRNALDKLLRAGPLELGGDVEEQRVIFEEMIRAAPVPADAAISHGSLGGVPVVKIGLDGAEPGRVILYLHGGAYTIGTAASAVGLAADLGRRARARLVSVDYRLAPEHPYPAALEDAVAAYRGLLADGLSPSAIAIAGESAGAGLVAATLVVLKREGLPQPSAAVLLSPWVDLTLSGDSIREKAALDPVLTLDGLKRRARDYIGAADPADELVSPVFAHLAGLPPLLVQAGSHEILLDDAVRIAARAAAADVAVTLQVTPQVPHVFQGFASVLDEAGAALSQAGDFIRSHLAAHPGGALGESAQRWERRLPAMPLSRRHSLTGARPRPAAMSSSWAKRAPAPLRDEVRAVVEPRRTPTTRGSGSR
jgi:acetyl esterase/lipase